MVTPSKSRLRVTMKQEETRKPQGGVPMYIRFPAKRAARNPVIFGVGNSHEEAE